MRIRVLSIVLFSVLLACILLLNASTDAGIESRGYGFDVSIAPEQSNPGIFVAQLTITNLSSLAIVAQPTVRFRAGEPAQSTMIEGDNSASFIFSVSVEQPASAQYEVKVLNGSSVVSRSKAKVSLEK